uniref:SDR family NAD(P)-dependent oxidoreductase n=1 Tax=Streptomyces bohaiensis TaxID=1431344 RepID=UPI0030C78095
TYAFPREDYWLHDPVPPGGSAWCHEERWEPLAPAVGTARRPGGWVLAVPAGQEDHPWSRALADGLAAAVLPVAIGGSFADPSGEDQDQDPGTAPATASALAERLRTLDTSGGVLSLLALDATPVTGHTALTTGLGATLALVQAVAALEGTRLWCATRGAVTTGAETADGGEAVTSEEALRQAPVWALGRVAALEQPRSWGGVLDLPPGHATPESVAAAVAALTSAVDDQVAVRGATVLGRRLAPSPAAAPEQQPWQPRGTVLVTGGTGGLGAQCARWLATHGADHVVLLSRGGPDAPGATDLHAELTADGHRVTVLACDVAERERLRGVLDSLVRDGNTPTAIVHAAGVLDDALLPGLTPQRLATVFAPKADAALHLHELTLAAGIDLDAFVLFSSSAASLGSPGQGNYAAANAVLDALARHRHARGLPATSLAWGPWAGAGMAGEHTVARPWEDRPGLHQLRPATALSVLARAAGSGRPATTVVSADWERLTALHATVRPTSYFDLIPRSRPAATAPAGSGAPAEAESAVLTRLRAELTALPEVDREPFVLRLVTSHVAAVLGHADGEGVPARRAFTELGLTSQNAVEIRGALCESTGIDVPVTVVFDHPTPHALARYVLGEVLGSAAAEPAGDPATAAASDAPVAILGMGCRFPGGDSPDAFWRHLLSGTDPVTEVPADRWNAADYHDPVPGAPGKAYTQRGGFLDSITGWDASFFGYTPREALRLDPQHRLVLELVWEAVENAGISPESLRGTRTGVFLGLAESQYGVRQITLEGPGCLDDPNFGLGTSASAAAGRVAYHLDLRGPTITVDTACSSSLVATHLAVQALRSGECDYALVAAANEVVGPEFFLSACKMGMLAPDGRTKTFDAAADGYAVGEGGGAVLLRRAADAAADGLRPHAVIRGTATNSDGRSNGLTAPNRHSQLAVIRAAHADAGVRAEEIDFVEAHGSGTALGDAIEYGVLTEVFGDRPADRPLHVGAVKSNIGHLLTAAGMAGLIKTVLALTGHELPPNLHLEKPNADVVLDGPVRPVTRREPVGHGTPGTLRAGVSSFGWSGTNAHLVVEAAPAEGDTGPAETDRAAAPDWHLLTVSGHTAEATAANARALADHLDAHPGLDLADVAHTLSVGRARFPYRRSLVCRDLPGAAAALRAAAPARAARETPVRHTLVLPGTGLPPETAETLRAAHPAFRDAWDACVDAARAEGAADPAADPALRAFAAEYAGTALLRAAGVDLPGTILAAGTGELAAACAADALALTDAVALLAAPDDTARAQRAAAAGYRAPRVTVRSLADGEVVPVADPEHWRRAARPSHDSPGTGSALAAADAPLLTLAAGPVTGLPGEIPLLALPEDGDAARSWLTVLGGLWDDGLTVDLALSRPRGARVLRLPTYAFQRADHWPAAHPDAGAAARPTAAAAPAAPAATDPGHREPHVLAPVWRREHTPPRTADPAPTTVLVLADPGELADALREQLEAAGHRALLVHPAAAHRAPAPGAAGTVDPADPAQVAALLAGLDTDTGPLAVLHALIATDPGQARTADPEQARTGAEKALDRGFHSLLWLARAAATTLPRRPLRLLIATVGAADVLGGEEIRPSAATATGATRSLLSEYPTTRARVTDLDAEAAAGDGAAHLLHDLHGLLADPAADTPPGSVPAAADPALLGAWRRGRPWTRSLDPVTLPEVDDAAAWRAGGTYAITGGTGELGLALAARLAPLGVRLALIGRTPLPPEDDWDTRLASAPEDDRTARVIREIRRLRALGAEVVTLTADITDPGDTVRVLGAVRERLGGLHGVVHAAGVAGNGLVQTKTREQASAVLAPKVAGTLALAAALRAEPVELLVLYSSVAGAIGGLGEADYAAANAFLDAFAAAEDGRGRVAQRVVSVAWGPWQRDRWQTAAFADNPHLLAHLLHSRRTHGLGDDAGTAALARAIVAGPSHLYVLGRPLAELAVESAGPPASPVAPVPRAARHPRPPLRTEYVAPRTEVERRVAEVWQDLLGIDAVGVHDPFFDLGGSSLVGLAVVARLSAEAGVDLAAATLFERPTVARLADLLDTDRPAPDTADVADAADEAAARGERRRARGRRTPPRRRGRGS